MTNVIYWLEKNIKVTLISQRITTVNTPNNRHSGKTGLFKTLKSTVTPKKGYKVSDTSRIKSSVVPQCPTPSFGGCTTGMAHQQINIFIRLAHISPNDKISDTGWGKISDIRYRLGLNITSIKYRISDECK